MFLSKIHWFCLFFYLKMIKGLFQISLTFLFPITFDQRLTDSITIGSLQIDTNVRSCCCELYDRRLLWANFCLKSEWVLGSLNEDLIASRTMIQIEFAVLFRLFSRNTLRFDFSRLIGLFWDSLTEHWNFCELYIRLLIFRPSFRNSISSFLLHRLATSE